MQHCGDPRLSAVEFGPKHEPVLDCPIPLNETHEMRSPKEALAADAALSSDLSERWSDGSSCSERADFHVSKRSRRKSGIDCQKVQEQLPLLQLCSKVVQNMEVSVKEKIQPDPRLPGYTAETNTSSKETTKPAVTELPLEEASLEPAASPVIVRVLPNAGFGLTETWPVTPGNHKVCMYSTLGLI